MKLFAKEIKYLLFKSGKKQKELADFLKISESSLSHLLSRGSFSPETLQLIAKFLNITYEELVSHAPDKNPLNLPAQSEFVEQLIQKRLDECHAKIKSLQELLAAKDQLISAKDQLIEQYKSQLPPHRPEKRKHKT